MPGEKEDIFRYVRQQEYLYRIGNTRIAKYVLHSLSETVQTIYAYLNSQYITGPKDSLQRDKPFFNIVVAARNIWFRATEIARKDIMIRETDSKHVVSAFLATCKLQEWMRKERFGVFLEEWGLTLAGFGSAITKFVQKNGRLSINVVPWNQMICDTINFEDNPKIEIFEYTKDKLMEVAQENGWDLKVVQDLINSPMIRRLITTELQDVKPYYIKVYEVHGVFPDSYLTGNPDDANTFSRQMHVVSYVRSKEKGKFDNFSLFKSKEDRDPYMLSHLLKEDGRTLSIGAVEHLFQAQWMVNHSMKAIKDQLDLASKLIFQTSDPTFAGQNVLTAIETGQILQHKINEPVTKVDNVGHDAVPFDNFAERWKALGAEINGITDSMAGVMPKAGTSWRLQSLQLQQAQMLFDQMKRNKGLAIEDMMRERIIPFIKTQLNTNKEIVAVLEAHDIRKIDGMYIPQEANRRFNDKLINHIAAKGKLPQPNEVNLQSELSQVQSEMQSQGNKRFFKPSEITSKTWKQIFKDLEWEVEVDVTGDASDRNAILQTLNTALQLVMNPAYANNPQAQLVVSKILLNTGVVSPLEVQTTMPPSQPAPQIAYSNPSTATLPVGQ